MSAVEPVDLELLNAAVEHFLEGRFAGKWLKEKLDDTSLYQPAKMTKLANAGFLEKGKATRGGSRQYYQVTQKALSYYRVAVEGNPPSEEDLKQLPRRAVVAYAARLARRVRPLFKCKFRELVAAVDNAIELSEKFANGVALPDVARFTRVSGDRGGWDESFAASDAAYWASVATYATDAANDAYRAYAAADDATAGRARAPACGDYVKLLLRSEKPFPAFGKAIDVATLGPLWPDGEPDWFSVATTEGTSEATPVAAELASMLATQGDVSPATLLLSWDPEYIDEDEYGRLFEALGELSRSSGGIGVKRLDSESYGVEIEAGVLR